MLQLKRQHRRSASKSPQQTQHLTNYEFGVRVLHWVVGIAQILLVGLGYYTYKYTLVPIYKQTVMENELSRITLELTSATDRKAAIELELKKAAVELEKNRRLAADASLALRSSETKALEANNRAKEAIRSTDTAKNEARGALRAKDEAVLEKEAALKQRDLAYSQMRRSVLDAIQLGVSTCENDRRGDRRRSEVNCFQRSGEQQEYILFNLLRETDSNALTRALELAGGSYVQNADELRARVNGDVKSTQEAYDAYKPDGTQAAMDRKRELAMAADRARDRRAELPIFAIPRLVQRLIEENLGSNWRR